MRRSCDAANAGLRLAATQSSETSSGCRLSGERDCLGLAAGPVETLAPSSAPSALTKMPCRFHSDQWMQGDGIHLRVTALVKRVGITSTSVDNSAAQPLQSKSGRRGAQ